MTGSKGDLSPLNGGEEGPWNRFWIALTFLTRLPVRKAICFNQVEMNRAAAWFPWVGGIVGMLAAGVLVLAALGLPISAAVILSMLFSVMLTGAFHEDGFADTCDALAGGNDPETRLSIMKDSRLGTFGAVGLWGILLLKWQLLVAIANLSESLSFMVFVLISAHVVSRWFAIQFMLKLPYVSGKDGKSKPLAQQLVARDQIIAIAPVVACLALVLLIKPIGFLFILAAVGFTFFVYWQALLKQKLGGYTGDTLGAAQQIAELLFYLSWLL